MWRRWRKKECFPNIVGDVFWWYQCKNARSNGFRIENKDRCKRWWKIENASSFERVSFKTSNKHSNRFFLYHTYIRIYIYIYIYIHMHILLSPPSLSRLSLSFRLFVNLEQPLICMKEWIQWLFHPPNRFEYKPLLFPFEWHWLDVLRWFSRSNFVLS